MIFSLWGGFFFYNFKDFYEQRLNCVFIIHAIRTVHDYFIFLLFTAIVTSMNFVYK